MSRKVPYDDIDAFSIPIFVTKGERPPIPKDCPKKYKELIRKCWHTKAARRPEFTTVVTRLKKQHEETRLKTNTQLIITSITKIRTNNSQKFDITYSQQKNRSEVLHVSFDDSILEESGKTSESLLSGSQSKSKV